MIEIRRAGCGEEHTILEFYDQLIDHMQDTEYPLRWKKGVYPVLSDIADALNMGALYVAEEDGNIAGVFIVNHTTSRERDIS